LRRTALGSFLIQAALAAGVGAACVLPWASRPDWAALGFAATAVPGLAAGAFLVRQHGRPGAGFVVALGAGMIARLLLGAAVASAAAWSDHAARTAAVAGLAAGFLPVMLFESLWFARSQAAGEQREARG
jgi:hypothetical protein